MLKHPDITYRRVKLFVSELKERLYGDTSLLSVQINERPCTNDSEALAGPWTPVDPGYRWGPAYRTVWFRVSGVVPASMDGKIVRVVADVGGERTVWRDGSPVFGVDHEHTDFGVLSGQAVQVGEKPAKAGDRIEVLLQAYARNPQVRVHGREPAREALVETVGRVFLTDFNPRIQELLYDAEFALSMLDGLAEGEPARAILLRALNEAINHAQWDDPESLLVAINDIQEGLDRLSGHPNHAVTPVGHAHLDTAWLWPIEITKKKMAHTTATQLGLMERYPWYIFAHSQASQYEWLELEYPHLFERVKSAIKKGQWEPVGSMWVEADCNIPSGESLVRQFLYGRRYFREKLGYETQDMFLPDVFGYSAALPQILAGFDIKYFLTQKISWNQSNKFPHNTFWWQGIDGTKVWSHFPPADTYIGNCEPQELLKSMRNHKDQARSDESLYLFGFGDGGGGPTERHLELLDRGRTAPLLPKLNAGKKVLDFFKHAYGESKDLVTWSGELYLEFHRGTYTSQAKNKWHNRRCEMLLRDAEMLAALLPGDYPAEALESAWKLVLLNQFHDIIPGSSVHEVYVDSEADYARVHEAGERVIAQKLGTGSGPLTLFQNARVPGQAEIAWNEPSAPASIRCGEERLPVQVVEAFGSRSLVFRTPQAALAGVAEAELSSEPAPVPYAVAATTESLESSEWRIGLNDNGNLTSVVSKADGQEYLAAEGLANVFQLLDDRPLFWSAWDVDPFAFETAEDLLEADSIRVVESGPVRAAVEVVRYFGKSRITQRISLGPTPGIRFDTEVDWHEENKMLKVAFPVAINAAKATYEIQYGHVERQTHYNTSWDQARFEVCAQKWVDLSEGSRGVALLNDCKYGHDIHDSVIRLSLLRSPKAPDPECDMGLHRFTYVLLPHHGSLREAGVVHHAYALNSPMRWGLGGSPLGKLVDVSSPDLVVESVKQAEDGDGVIVRLYECHNTRGEANLSLTGPIRSAVRCNLEERGTEKLEVVDDTVRIQYRPFEIITVRLKM